MHDRRRCCSVDTTPMRKLRVKGEVLPVHSTVIPRIMEAAKKIERRPRMHYVRVADNDISYIKRRDADIGSDWARTIRAVFHDRSCRSMLLAGSRGSSTQWPIA
nr:hypothetical protein CFP56_67331 [Quercus suber]